MIKLLSYFGNGLLYILLTPYYVIKYALSFVFALLVFVGGEIISLFHFLSGKKYRNVDELSIRLETLIRQEALQKQTIVVPNVNQSQMNPNFGAYPNPPYGYTQNYYPNNPNQYPNYPNNPNQYPPYPNQQPQDPKDK